MPLRPRGRRDAANTPNALMRGVPFGAPPSAPRPVVTPPPTVPSGPSEPTHLPAGIGGCQKAGTGTRKVRVTLKPEADLGDLIAWISSVTCKQFLLPGGIPANSKKVTIIAPQPISRADAYQLFLSALDSVDLTVEPTGRFLRIIETLHAKTSSLPFYGDAVAPAAPEPNVTRLVRVEHTSAGEAAVALARLKGDDGQIVVADDTSLIITDSAANVKRMLAVLRDLDRAGPAEKP
jgi:general secretion pathway protein D